MSQVHRLRGDVMEMQRRVNSLEGAVREAILRHSEFVFLP